MIRPAPEPQRSIVGTFLVLAAVVAAVAPMATSLRSAAIALLAYLAFAVGGLPFAYLAALLAPALGLLAGGDDWLVMLPIVLSGNLLAMLALEFAWRWWAVLLSPLLLVVPALFVQAMAERELFRVALPWGAADGAWVGLHALVGVFGVLVAILAERRRLRRDAAPPARAPALSDAERARRVAPPRHAAGDAPATPRSTPRRG